MSNEILASWTFELGDLCQWIDALEASKYHSPGEIPIMLQLEQAGSYKMTISEELFTEIKKITLKELKERQRGLLKKISEVKDR